MRLYKDSAACYEATLNMKAFVAMGIDHMLSNEAVIDSMKGALSTHIRRFSVFVPKTTLYALHMYMFGDPKVTYHVAKGFCIVPRKYAVKGTERHNVRTTLSLLRLLYPEGIPRNKGEYVSSYRVVCEAWVTAAHAVKPQVSFAVCYEAYMHVLRWLSTGTCSCPSTKDMNITYKILDEMQRRIR